MFLVALAAYFVLACFVSWLILFPSGREFFLHALAGAGQRWQDRVLRAAQRQGRGAAHLGQLGGAGLRQIGALAGAHRLLLAACAVLLLAPALLAVLSGGSLLDGFDSPAREINPQVAQLLEGEQLVPPPALPPLAFTTAELQQERPMLASASREWQLMDPQYAQRLLMVFKIMKERHGYDMALLEGYRSPERQNLLAAMGPGVTNAAAFQSWHQYGMAADCAFLREGRIVISEKDPWALRGYQLYGEVAESLGLTWGGRWKMMDFGHTELRRAGVMRRQ
ncbi:MAG: M15 family metallopeptidase [Massilia sp.]